MNAKIIPIFILLAAIALSGTAPSVYAEEINEVTVVHEAPVRESDSRPVIAPAPEEDMDGEPLIIAPKPIEHDASAGEKVIAPVPDTDSPAVIQAEDVRPWSGEVQSEPMVAHGDLIGLEEPAAADGEPETSEASFTGPVEWLFDAIASFFQGIFGWLTG